MVIDRPVRFSGSEEQRRANYDSHYWIVEDPEEPLRCADCDSKAWHAAASYPCGVEPPREVVEVGPAAVNVERELRRDS